METLLSTITSQHISDSGNLKKQNTVGLVQIV